MSVHSAASVIEPVGERDVCTLPWMPVGVNRDFDTGVAELFRHVLNRGMVLIELDRRVAVTQIVNTVGSEPRLSTHPFMDALEGG
jgi:hypothetical protein